MLALLAVAAGAEAVTCVEMSQMAYRAAHLVLQQNLHTPGWEKIKLSPVPLRRCYSTLEDTQHGDLGTDSSNEGETLEL